MSIQQKTTKEVPLLGGTERIQLYETLTHEPLKILDDPELLKRFYQLFGKPVIRPVPEKKENTITVRYIWYIPPVFTSVYTNPHYYYDAKQNVMYLRVEQKKYNPKTRNHRCMEVQLHDYQQVEKLLRAPDIQ